MSKSWGDSGTCLVVQWLELCSQQGIQVPSLVGNLRSHGQCIPHGWENKTTATTKLGIQWLFANLTAKGLNISPGRQQSEAVHSVLRSGEEERDVGNIISVHTGSTWNVCYLPAWPWCDSAGPLQELLWGQVFWCYQEAHYTKGINLEWL